jgi:thiol reductant ABC exporter CydC subunit
MTATTTAGHPAPLRGLFPYLFSSKTRFALVVLSGLLFAGLSIATAGLGAHLVSAAVTGSPWIELSPVLWWFVACAVGTGIASWWTSDIQHDWAFSLLRDLRVHVYDGLERAAPRTLLGKRTGELTGTAIADVNTTEMFFAHTAGDYLGAVVVSVASLGVIAAIDVPVAAATGAVMVLVAVIPFLLAARAAEQGRRLRDELGVLGADALDGIQGLRELVVFRATDRHRDLLAERTDDLQVSQRVYARRSAAEQVATDLLLGAGVVLVLLIGVARLRAGDLDGAWLPVLLVLSTAALVPIATVSGTARTLGEVRAAAARVLAIIGYPEQVPDTGRAQPAASTAVGVRFEDVTFRYTEDGPDVLRGLDFEVRPGETVALVGRSGAGKSTCANLLLRFWDVTGGSIRVGGLDTRTMPLTTLRELVTLVPQEAYLFTMSVRENIRLARPDAGDEEIEHAARLAAAHEFITALPDGYDTLAGERGTNLSGGQRQRIAIARALLKDAPVIVMDEAVSSLDTANEQIVQAAIMEASRGRTVLAIAHRLSTIQNADRVVFLADGRVADTGTHTELLARHPGYRELLATRHAVEAGAPVES